MESHIKTKRLTGSYLTTIDGDELPPKKMSKKDSGGKTFKPSLSPTSSSMAKQGGETTTASPLLTKSPGRKKLQRAKRGLKKASSMADISTVSNLGTPKSGKMDGFLTMEASPLQTRAARKMNAKVGALLMSVAGCSSSVELQESKQSTRKGRSSTRLQEKIQKYESMVAPKKDNAHAEADTLADVNVDEKVPPRKRSPPKMPVAVCPPQDGSPHQKNEIPQLGQSSTKEDEAPKETFFAPESVKPTPLSSSSDVFEEEALMQLLTISVREFEERHGESVIFSREEQQKYHDELVVLKLREPHKY